MPTGFLLSIDCVLVIHTSGINVYNITEKLYAALTWWVNGRAVRINIFFLFQLSCDRLSCADIPTHLTDHQRMEKILKLLERLEIEVYKGKHSSTCYGSLTPSKSGGESENDTRKNGKYHRKLLLLFSVNGPQSFLEGSFPTMPVRIFFSKDILSLPVAKLHWRLRSNISAHTMLRKLYTDVNKLILI